MNGFSHNLRTQYLWPNRHRDLETREWLRQSLRVEWKRRERRELDGGRV